MPRPSVCRPRSSLGGVHGVGEIARVVAEQIGLGVVQLLLGRAFARHAPPFVAHDLDRLRDLARDRSGTGRRSTRRHRRSKDRCRCHRPGRASRALRSSGARKNRRRPARSSPGRPGRNRDPSAGCPAPRTARSPAARRNRRRGRGPACSAGSARTSASGTSSGKPPKAWSTKALASAGDHVADDRHDQPRAHEALADEMLQVVGGDRRHAGLGAVGRPGIGMTVQDHLFHLAAGDAVGIALRLVDVDQQTNCGCAPPAPGRSAAR